MQDELLFHYENELRFIRRMAADFAKKYPAVASRLELPREIKESEDPHVERLIEAFALLTARIRAKIDDEFPEITEALLGMLYPHYLRPVPSMAIFQIELDPEQSKMTGGYPIARGREIFSKPVMGVPVQFRTAYPLTLWPLKVVRAAVVRGAAIASLPGLAAKRGLGDAFAAIRIELKTFPGVRWAELELGSLRFFLNGDGQITHTLHELIFNNAFGAIVRDATAGTSPVVELPGEFVGEVGFDMDESLLPYELRSFPGYRLLQELFAFPQKFLFFDVLGLDRARQISSGHLELILLLNEFGLRERLIALERSVNADTFLLGCTPAVNLFERQAEPIRVTETDTEYRVVGDRYQQASIEIYSVDRVVSSRPDTEETVTYQPFYSHRHAYADDPAQTAFWLSNRRASLLKDDRGTEVYLSMVNLQFRPTDPPTDLLNLRVTCTNRDLPAKLPITGAEGEFEVASGPLLVVRCRFRPTETLRPAARRGLQWRLISHLSLNGMSIVSGPEAIQEILKLYDFSEDPVVARQIAGITGVQSKNRVARVTSENGIVMCLGTQVEMEFDEEQFVGTSAFLMASVLERFLALYSALNSFTQLTATTKQRKGILKQWPPRSGDQILV